MVVLMSTLTRGATIGCGVGFQALTLDRLAATHADAESAQRYALQGALDRPDFLHVARDFRQIHVDQKVGQGLILEIADTSGNIRVAFVIGARERLLRLVP